MLKRLLAAVALSALALSTLPASAATLDATCSIAGGSATSPHAIDAKADGLLSGVDPEVDPHTTPHDVTDIHDSWFSRAADGTVSANVSVNQLLPVTENLVFYVRWNYPDTDGVAPDKSIRFVSVQLRTEIPGAMPQGTFRYGFLDTTTPGLQTLVSEGYTTGSWSAGTPGVISIVVPFASMGNPASGEALTSLIVQARALVGHPGHGHPEINPNGASGGGVVTTVDDSTNAEDLCDTITV